MELHELRGYKKELESRLIHSIARDIEWFEKRTEGWSPKDIHVRMVEKTIFGDWHRRYTLGSVSVELEDI